MFLWYNREMDKHFLQRYLHEHIPISAAMQVCVIEADAQRVSLSAPLQANINHRETVFGGSACAVAILAAWSLLYIRLGGQAKSYRLVIQHNSMSYDLPIESGFAAHCELPDQAHWDKFIKVLRRRGRARITLDASVSCQGKTVAALQGVFVALEQ